VSFCEFEDFLERGNSFAREGTTKPGSSVKTAEFSKSEIVNGALAVGRAVYAFIVNRNEPRIARKLQIRFDETHAHGNCFAKCCHGIFWCVTGRATMRNKEQR
jgi:hypothetical protein